MNYENYQGQKISVSELCTFAGYTRAGLVHALDNDTIELRRVKLLCDNLKISPALFFTNYVDIDSGKLLNEIQTLKTENEMLKNQVKDKLEIISLLREKNISSFDAVAENKSKLAEYLKTKK